MIQFYINYNLLVAAANGSAVRGLWTRESLQAVPSTLWQEGKSNVFSYWSDNRFPRK